MITEVIDNGNTIRLVNQDKLDDKSTVIYDLEKTSGIKIKYLEKEDFINIWDEARRMFFTLKHTEVQKPVTANTLALYEYIIGLLNNPISVEVKDSFGRTANVDVDNIERLLKKIIDLQKETNKYLSKIYCTD